MKRLLMSFVLLLGLSTAYANTGVCTRELLSNLVYGIRPHSCLIDPVLVCRP